MKKIVLAGGCFWGVEAYINKIKGVSKTIVGYIDGLSINPSYKDVCDGSGHAEAVYIEYNEKRVSLELMLKHFFRIINPTELNRQGNDIGIQYRTAIYYYNEPDKFIIINYIIRIQKQYSSKIQTKVLPAINFYEAESYHQKYLEKNPNGYCHINLDLIKEKFND